MVHAPFTRLVSRRTCTRLGTRQSPKLALRFCIKCGFCTLPHASQSASGPSRDSIRIPKRRGYNALTGSFESLQQGAQLQFPTRLRQAGGKEVEMDRRVRSRNRIQRSLTQDRASSRASRISFTSPITMIAAPPLSTRFGGGLTHNLGVVVSPTFFTASTSKLWLL